MGEIGFYKEKIIELLNKIEDKMLLVKIYTFIKTWLE